VGDSGRPKHLKKCMKLNWNFQRGEEVLEKISSVGDVWIFYGTTHFQQDVNVTEGLHFISFLHVVQSKRNLHLSVKKLVLERP